MLMTEIAIKQINMQMNGEFSSVLNTYEKDERVMLNAGGRAQFQRWAGQKSPSNYIQV